MRKRQREKGCRSIIDKDDILSGWWENEWISTRWIAWSHHAVLWRMNWEQRLLPVLRAHFFFLSLHFRLSQNILQTFFIHEHWIFTDKNFAKNMFVKKKKTEKWGKKENKFPFIDGSTYKLWMKYSFQLEMHLTFVSMLWANPTKILRCPL